MDLRLNLEYIVENPDHTKKLAAALDTTNVSLKKQVFEILGALCVYSADGYSRALEVLEHYKSNKDERYRFKLVVEQLRNGRDLELLSAVAAFLNCSIIAAKSLKDRIRIRNEYLGLKILDAISLLRTRFSDNESDLFVQLDIFDEQRLADECQLTGPSGVDLSSHQDVFYAILRQVAGSPLEFPFLNILQHLLRIDASLPISDVLWDTSEKLVHRTTLCETKEDAEKLIRLPIYHHSLNKLQESGGRCQCSCHGEGRARKRTPLQLTLSVSDAPGIIPFNPQLLASASQQSPMPPPPPPPPLPPPPPPPLKATPKVTDDPITKLPQQFTPRPKNKMKTFNWTKIPSAKVVGKTNLWSLIAKAHDGSPINLDFESIEGLFCQSNLMNGSLTAQNGRDSLDRKKRESTEINLLDGKRSLNVNIFLKQFRSSNEEIIAILQKGAHADIGAEKLRGLMKILPESDEIELLRGHAGERNKLGKAEQFLLQLIELPNYKLRCEGMLLKEEFSTNMTYLEPAIETIESAVEELRHCQELHEVLYMLVVMGNFLNSGSYAGDAAGFKMMSLLKVAEIRANKPGMNLIHYVVQEAENKFPNLLKFPELLSSVEAASKLSIDNLKTEIVNLSNKLEKISLQVSASSEDVRHQMVEFLKFATRETAQVQKELDNLEKVRVDMAEFLCEDLQSFKLEECFRVFHSFCQKFKSAVEENEKRRQNERRAAQRRKHREEQVIRKNFGENRPSSFSGSESDNFLDKSLPTTSEEDPIASPQVGRRRIGSDTQSPTTRRRSRLSSSDREANLMDFLRSTAEVDGVREKSESGSLDRAWLRRSSRRRRPEMLSVELNDRERPVSPLLERKSTALEENRPKQWRLKIEEWLQENEKEQTRDRKLRDKIAFERLKRQEMENETIAPGDQSEDKGLAVLQEVKTDSEIYAKKPKNPKQSEREVAESMPPKDKSKWRKSNLNVANSSESIDDERRRSRSRRNASDPEMDTISFYITQSAENLIPGDRKDTLLSLAYDRPPRQNVACIPKDLLDTKDIDKVISDSKDSKEMNPGILIERNRLYQTVEESVPKKVEQIYNQSIIDDDEMQEPNHRNVCDLKRSDAGETRNEQPDREDVNFDRFSHMRKTTRRGKPRIKTSENEIKKSDDLVNSDPKVDSKENQADDSRTQKGFDHDVDMDPKFVEGAFKEIPQSNKEMPNLSDEIVKNSGSLFNKYVGGNGEFGDEQKRKDKSASLKTKLSKTLLSLTENLKSVAKPVDTEDSSEDKKNNLINDFSYPQIDKILSERRSSLNVEKINPIMEHREKILSRPRQDIVHVPVKNKVQSSCSPIIIAKPRFLKDSYISDANNVRTVHTPPVTDDVKGLVVYPVQKGREECEKDEGFEETQSQLSEAASQGAGSSYDTDLTDSPRSGMQIKDANEAKNIYSNILSTPVNSAESKMQADNTKEKTPQRDKLLKPNIPALNCCHSGETAIAGKTTERVHLSKSNPMGLQNSKTANRKNQRSTFSAVGTKNFSAKPQMPANLRLNGKTSRSKVSGSDGRTAKNQSLKGFGNLIETSPKIGRRVAAYTKAIKSMTDNLKDSKKFENYDVTQSMPPTPSEENKTFASGLLPDGSGKKARSSSSVCSLRTHRRQSNERSMSACLASPSRRGSEKSISSDISLNLSRKSSEASVITVKSANRRSPVPKRATVGPNRFISPTKSKAKPVRPVQNKQFRVPSSVKPIPRSNIITKPTSSTVLPKLAVRRTSSERASFTFMKATSASSAKTAPTKWTQDKNKFKSQNNQRSPSKPISLTPPPSRIKQRY